MSASKRSEIRATNGVGVRSSRGQLLEVTASNYLRLTVIGATDSR